MFVLGNRTVPEYNYSTESLERGLPTGLNGTASDNTRVTEDFMAAQRFTTVLCCSTGFVVLILGFIWLICCCLRPEILQVLMCWGGAASKVCNRVVSLNMKIRFKLPWLSAC